MRRGATPRRAPAREHRPQPEESKRSGGFGMAMERFSRAATDATGSTPALLAAVGLIVAWLLSGPLFHFSDTWQLVINTTTTIVTFLMVFLIQRAQNKDAKAVSAKLNELIAAIEGASNRLIDVESLSEAEIETLHRHFQRLAELSKRDTSMTRSHSIEEAELRHERKTPTRRNHGRPA